MTGAARATQRSPKLPAGLGRVVLAEWTKFRSVRSSLWTLLIALAVAVAFVLLIGSSFLDDYDRMSPAERAALDPAANREWNHAMPLGQVVVAILGTLVASSEYSTGTIRATLASVPSRMLVFVAKTVSVAAIALVAGLALAFATFAVAQPFLAERSLDLSLTDAAVLRGVALAALATMGYGLLGLGFGLLIRHTAGAIGAVVTVLLVVPILQQPVAEGWGEVLKFLPANASWAMLWSQEGEVALAEGAATAVFLGYIAVLLTVAGTLFTRRDA
jgi:ABC-2 type transport system permease protein